MPARLNPSHTKPAIASGARVPTLRLLLATALMATLLTGCLDLNPLPTATPSPLPATETPTFVIPTLIPTTTWTPPIAPPTSEIDTAMGEIIFEDDFEQDRGWNLEEDFYGATALTSGRLTLATRRPGAWRFAMVPVPTMTDFYMEINLRAEICSSGDEFGVMFRVNPVAGYYRFGLRCEGGARVTRILGETAYALVPRDQADIVVPGPPEQNQLAVWAHGSQFRFFINQVETFSARDSSLTMGSLGLYIFSGNAGQTTVSFDDLIIRSAIAAPTQTPTPDVPE